MPHGVFVTRTVFLAFFWGGLLLVRWGYQLRLGGDHEVLLHATLDNHGC
jgi:hypothetical protein